MRKILSLLVAMVVGVTALAMVPSPTPVPTNYPVAFWDTVYLPLDATPYTGVKQLSSGSDTMKVQGFWDCGANYFEVTSVVICWDDPNDEEAGVHAALVSSTAYGYDGEYLANFYLGTFTVTKPIGNQAQRRVWYYITFNDECSCSHMAAVSPITITVNP